jgi:putative PIN family toxin of toxin-antitoxin system
MAVSQLLVSEETLQELHSVLSRPRFDAYLSSVDRLRFFYLLRRTAMFIESVPAIAACRDPKDDKFISLASAGRATMILTGDRDLLVLHPFCGIEILTPRQYLDR